MTSSEPRKENYNLRRYIISTPSPPPQPLQCSQLSAYRLQSNSRFAASILRLCRGPFGLKGRRFYGQAKRLLYFGPNLEVLCRTSISKGLHSGVTLILSNYLSGPIVPPAAKPLLHLTTPVRSTHNPVGKRSEGAPLMPHPSV